MRGRVLVAVLVGLAVAAVAVVLIVNSGGTNGGASTALQTENEGPTSATSDAQACLDGWNATADQNGNDTNEHLVLANRSYASDVPQVLVATYQGPRAEYTSEDQPTNRGTISQGACWIVVGRSGFFFADDPSLGWVFAAITPGSPVVEQVQAAAAQPPNAQVEGRVPGADAPGNGTLTPLASGGLGSVRD
jgi:hypothetical protein